MRSNRTACQMILIPISDDKKYCSLNESVDRAQQTSLVIILRRADL